MNNEEDVERFITTRAWVLAAFDLFNPSDDRIAKSALLDYRGMHLVIPVTVNVRTEYAEAVQKRMDEENPEASRAYRQVEALQRELLEMRRKLSDIRIALRSWVDDE